MTAAQVPKKYKYFNQYNYAHVPYPSPSLPKATVASGGCGVCCAAMIVGSMTDFVVDPAAMAAYAIKKGARVSGGTDMTVLAKAIGSDYGLVFETSSDENHLLEHLASGGMAVCNVGGDRAGWTGLFSSEGHFIVAAGCSGKTVTIMDPGYYKGKFDSAGRKGKIAVNGDFCYCNISDLGADTSNRSPAYWLFSTLKGAVDVALEKWMVEGGEAALDSLTGKGLINTPDTKKGEENLAANVPAYLFWIMLDRLSDYKVKG